jgi:hypothetical protein
MASTTYSVDESEIGGSGCVNLPTGTSTGTYSCGGSASYSLNPNIDDGGSSLGENAVGNSSSASYSTNSGFDTTAQPGLMITVSGTPAGLGVLSTGAARTAVATFSVRDYTSSKYIVQIIGATPAYAGHNLTAMTTNAWGDASANNNEQFGINLVANTTPNTAGADPVCQTGQTPGPTTYCSGVAGSGTGTYGLNGVGGTPYTVGGRYRYVSGETIASGPASSGETDYTITFLANQGPATVAGAYTGNLAIVATGTY